MNADAWARRDAAVVWHGFTQMSCYPESTPITVASGDGNYLVDVDGKRYLDAISSLWVTTLGHNDPDLNAAIQDQLSKVAHSTLLGNGNVAAIEFAEALSQQVPVKSPHVLFASDGATAVEQALKIAFQYWHNQGITTRDTYLTLDDAYHGDSVGTLSLGAGGFGTSLFDPLRFPVLRTPGYNDPDWLAKGIAAINDNHERIAALVIEPMVQGAAGILVADAPDVKQLVEAAQEKGVPVICDEVATGFGRTGTLFASQQCEISPDILCLGKGISGGYLPLSATVVADHIFNEFLGEDLGERTFYHGHSYSGNAVACAAGLRHLELLAERNIMENVRAADAALEQFLAPVAAHRHVREVRRRGLMTGVELNPPAGTDKWGRKVCASTVRRGVLLRPLGDVVVIMAPLTITESEIATISRVLVEALDELPRP